MVNNPKQQSFLSFLCCFTAEAEAAAAENQMYIESSLFIMRIDAALTSPSGLRQTCPKCGQQAKCSQLSMEIHRVKFVSVFLLFYILIFLISNLQLLFADPPNKQTKVKLTIFSLVI